MKNQNKVESQEELSRMYANLNRYYYKLAGQLHNSGLKRSLKCSNDNLREQAQMQRK